MKLLFSKELKSGEFNNLRAECLTDTWIGKERWISLSLSLSCIPRCSHTHTYMNSGIHTPFVILILVSKIFWIRWAFIDLSAGPFSWGPAVGGEGVRTELSSPNVQKTIGAVSGTATSFTSDYSIINFTDHVAMFDLDVLLFTGASASLMLKCCGKNDIVL